MKINLIELFGCFVNIIIFPKKEIGMNITKVKLSIEFIT